MVIDWNIHWVTARAAKILLLSLFSSASPHFIVCPCLPSFLSFSLSCFSFSVLQFLNISSSSSFLFHFMSSLSLLPVSLFLSFSFFFHVFFPFYLFICCFSLLFNLCKITLPVLKYFKGCVACVWCCFRHDIELWCRKSSLNDRSRSLKGYQTPQPCRHILTSLYSQIILSVLQDKQKYTITARTCSLHVFDWPTQRLPCRIVLHVFSLSAHPLCQHSSLIEINGGVDLITLCCCLSERSLRENAGRMVESTSCQVLNSTAVHLGWVSFQKWRPVPIHGHCESTAFNISVYIYNITQMQSPCVQCLDGIGDKRLVN